MSELSTTRLLGFARRLLPAASFVDLITVASEEVRAAIGYAHCWFMVADDEQAEELRMIEVSGAQRDLAWEVAPVLKVKGDAFLETLIASDEPVVIVDARIDPRTNKVIVEQLQNRTLINVPLRLLDKPFGIFGVGTFGDEGCRAPSVAELDYLVAMASQIAVAAGRIRFIEAQARAEREMRELERKLAHMQRLESLGMLAGGIAHDFNNLLTVILSGAGLAERASTQPSVREELQSVISAATRARDLTRQLLAMSRSQQLHLRPIDLNTRLAEMRDMLQRIFPVTLQLDLIRAAHLPSVDGDASQLDQVFMNLCINARDAMPNGGRLTLETEQVLINGDYAATHPWARPGRYVLVTVSDTGSGISSENLERIFEPFFTTKAPQAGTGLGLAVAYGIVRQHGGMLHCYSELGVGTTFKVYLPAYDRLAIAVGDKLMAAAPGGQERILLAEDDEGVRKVARRILEGAGYQVEVAENGDVACEIAARESFALAVLDVIMPGSPCAETVARLKALRPEMKLLLSSGYTAGANILELLKATKLELLRKPYDPDELLRSLRRALDA